MGAFERRDGKMEVDDGKNGSRLDSEELMKGFAGQRSLLSLCCK